MHLLLFLHPDDSFLDPIHIDEIVMAEFPDLAMDPTGDWTEIVRSAMTHGPCGITALRAPCMIFKDGGHTQLCSKRYPRPFQAETVVQED